MRIINSHLGVGGGGGNPLLLDPSLEGLWRCQETTGTTVSDTSGNDRDGFTVGMGDDPDTDAGPRPELPIAFVLNGSTTSVTLPGIIAPASGQSAQTFIGRFYTQDTAQGGYFSSAGQRFYVDWVSTNYRTGVGNSFQTSATPVVKDEWVSIALVSDGASGLSGEATTFVNGVPIHTFGYGWSNQGPQDLRIGFHNFRMTGLVCDLAYFSRGLIPAELAAWHNDSF